MTFVDFACRLKGGPIPADHGYPLYSALTKILPALHPPENQAPRIEMARREAPLWLSVAIHPIRGKLIGNRRLLLTPDSRLTIRIPSGRLEEVLPLIGRELLLDGCKVAVGTPEILPLVARPRLYSRLVVIKGATDQEHFLQTATRQLAALGIHAELGIPYKQSSSRVEGPAPETDGQEVLRRTLRIGDKTIVGFAMVANGLSADESITLQEQGLGGRRRFGCGVFIPASP
jgi:CRISPR-associated protein Cas6